MYEDKDGYMILSIYNNGEPIAIKEHRLNTLIENSLHDVLNNVVHHKNHCKFDNRVENLELMGRSEHKSLHKHSLKTRKKMSEARTGNKHPSFNPCITIRKMKSKTCKRGYTWRAHPSTKDGTLYLQSVDLDTCIQKVIDFINSEENVFGFTHYEVKGDE